jgi:hypothetical protein
VTPQGARIGINPVIDRTLKWQVVRCPTCPEIGDIFSTLNKFVTCAENWIVVNALERICAIGQMPCVVVYDQIGCVVLGNASDVGFKICKGQANDTRPRACTRNALLVENLQPFLID